jgi:hypothetical protein
MFHSVLSIRKLHLRIKSLVIESSLLHGMFTVARHINGCIASSAHYDMEANELYMDGFCSNPPTFLQRPFHTL